MLTGNFLNANMIAYMLILGIDTSSPKGSIAVTLKNKVISETTVSVQTSYSKKLFPLIDSTLQKNNIVLSQILAFAVSAGPGSFTGLRLGVSAALGFSLSLEKPVIPIETLSAMAHTIPYTEFLICPIIDARKGELYTAFFKYGKDKKVRRIENDRVIRPEILINEINQPTIFFGTGVDVYGGILRRELKDKAIFSDCFLNSIAASAAKLAYMKIQKGGHEDFAQLKLKYVRRSEAEIKASILN